MTNAFSAPGWPIERGVQTLKEVHYLNMRTQSAAAGLSKLWSDTFLTSAGINAGASSGYTYRGASNYDVIRNSSSPVALLLHLNDDGKTDDSASPGTGTLNGDATFSSAQKKFGSTSLYCDGTGDYLRYADAAKWDMGTGDFCVEGFFYFSSIADVALWDIGGYYAANGIGVRCDGTTIYFMCNNATVASGAHGMSTGSWYHVAVVRNSGTVKVYVAGVEKASASFSTSLSTSYGLDVGGSGGGSRYMNGYIDEFRFSNTARYTSGFTPPSAAFTTDANTILLCHFESLATDSSTYAHAVTHAGNATISTAQKKFGVASCLFDATGDYLSVADNDVLDFGAGQFTLDFWVRFSGTGAQSIMAKAAAGGSDGWSLIYVTGALQFTANATGNIFNYSWTPTANTWYHLAIVRSASNLWTLYIDGTSVATSSSTATITSNAEPVTIGKAPTWSGGVWVDISASGGTQFNGYMDEIRFTTNARWSANFTAPTSEGTAEAAGDGVVQSVQCLSLSAAVTSAMVFCEKTVNAGAVTVEISSDNGSTWTTVTNLDQIISIPSGTQIVLRATITSDAELESWGVAV